MNKIRIWEGYGATSSPYQTTFGAASTNLALGISDPAVSRLGAYRNGGTMRMQFQNFTYVNDIIKLQWCWANIRQGERLLIIDPTGVQNNYVEIPDQDLFVYVTGDSTSTSNVVNASIEIPKMTYSHGYWRFVDYQYFSTFANAKQVGGFIIFEPNRI